ncbi:ABC transporter ATP-binding protein [Blastococcus tunisiensis]|jgi:branched-chain amino acid transport system ATP-binding protein|uniref:Branched-chain amino acid transport system ATP-binding protein n=1 Tax=Blastococcus tunisiensis TaxID=1798228 RepID=A0A1I2BQW4_9ACTN|nr:ABC transporter ATP-binding protein [Blastococcus sp. DSM 46838]SFE58521.1 branched-chain amino acid transport system ATP-binding protein [Blastococcus sp. DSM 46838]
MLEVSGLRSGYGDVTVLRGISFSLDHEIFAVLGANGAGKSTLLKTLARLLPITGGSLTFRGRDVTQSQPHRLAAAGLAYVPQESNVFPDLTVAENLSIGGLIGTRTKEERLEELFDLFPALSARMRQKAGTLSGGEGQMVAVGRALMQDPSLILLDEPTAGLSPKYADALFSMISTIHRDKGLSVVLAEQNASKTLAIAHRAMVLNLGEVFVIDQAANLDTDSLREGYRL